MEFPGIPTDNLYKFMALSGVAIAISNTYFYVSKVYEYKDELIAHKTELEFLAPLTQGAAIFGIVLAVAGFWLWYIKVQKPIDIEQKANSELALLKLEYERNNVKST